MLVQTVFRLLCYGDMLPNTYYLKMAAYLVLLRVGHSLLMPWQFVQRVGYLPLPVPSAVLLFWRTRASVLLVGIFPVQVLCSTYVGGNAWEPRVMCRVPG